MMRKLSNGVYVPFNANAVCCWWLLFSTTKLNIQLRSSFMCASLIVHSMNKRNHHASQVGHAWRQTSSTESSFVYMRKLLLLLLFCSIPYNNNNMFEFKSIYLLGKRRFTCRLKGQHPLKNAQFFLAKWEVLIQLVNLCSCIYLLRLWEGRIKRPHLLVI